jgi:alpha-beta hydrolase superfamily lysophospholipase
MRFETLDVHSAEGHALRVGVCAHGCTGPAVLIVPGLYSHMGWYRPIGEALAERGAIAFLLDRRGAGISEGVPGHMDSWRHLVDDILRVVARIAQLHPSARVCALGVSLGAAITLATSLVQPQCFARQAALSPGLAPAIRIPLRQRALLAYRGFLRPHHPYELPFTMEHLTDDEEHRQALWNDPLRTRSFTARFLLEVFRMQSFVRRNIVRLRAPLLALLAEDDTMVDNRVTMQTLERVVAAPVRMEVFARAQHVLPASLPLADIVDRIDRWFTAEEAELDLRVELLRVPQPAGGGAEA